MMSVALAMGTRVVAMAQEDDPYREERQALVTEIKVQLSQLRAQSGLSAPTDPVLEAIAKVPRHAFVPAHLAKKAYRNRPLPIGHPQTISQPLIVALMSTLAEVDKSERVLEVEVCTGSGYQTAVLGLWLAKSTRLRSSSPWVCRLPKDFKNSGTITYIPAPAMVIPVGPTTPPTTRSSSPRLLITSQMRWSNS